MLLVKWQQVKNVKKLPTALLSGLEPHHTVDLILLQMDSVVYNILRGSLNKHHIR